MVYVVRGNSSATIEVVCFFVCLCRRPTVQPPHHMQAAPRPQAVVGSLSYYQQGTVRAVVSVGSCTRSARMASQWRPYALITRPAVAPEARAANSRTISREDLRAVRAVVVRTIAIASGSGSVRETARETAVAREMVRVSVALTLTGGGTNLIAAGRATVTWIDLAVTQPSALVCLIATLSLRPRKWQQGSYLALVQAVN